MKHRPRRRLNPQRRRLLKELMKGKTIPQAAIAAGYKNPASGYVAVHQMRNRMIAEVERIEKGPEYFVREKLLPMLERKKTLFFNSNGIVTDKRIVEDTPAQLQAMDMYNKLLGAYAPVSIEHSGMVEHVLTEREKQDAVKSLETILTYDSEDENPLLAESVEE